MKAALIDGTNVVINIIVWDETCIAPEDVTCVVLPNDAYVSIGWSFNGGESFTDPNPPVQNTAAVPPTLADLQSQLAALTASIQALSGGN